MILCDMSSDGFVEYSLGPAGFTLDMVYVPKEARGRGVANLMLDVVLAMSDQTGIPVWLIPASMDGGPNNTVLESWYGRRGFVDVGGSMLKREPRQTQKGA